jgi:hypothetical protein
VESHHGCITKMRKGEDAESSVISIVSVRLLLVNNTGNPQVISGLPDPVPEPYPRVIYYKWLESHYCVHWECYRQYSSCIQVQNSGVEVEDAVE